MPDVLHRYRTIKATNPLAAAQFRKANAQALAEEERLERLTNAELLKEYEASKQPPPASEPVNGPARLRRLLDADRAAALNINPDPKDAA